MPATAGPMAVARLNMVELRAMALLKSSRSTSSITKAWRAGASNALAMPRAKASTTICHGWIQPRKVSAARMKGQDHHDGLGHQEQCAPRHAVGDHPAVQGEDPRGCARSKADEAQVGRRTGQLEDEEAQGRALHPGAHERSRLAHKPQPVVAIPQRGKGLVDTEVHRGGRRRTEARLGCAVWGIGGALRRFLLGRSHGKLRFSCGRQRGLCLPIASC